MFLTLMKTIVKNALHQAAEEFAEEFGLPEQHVLQMRQQRATQTEEALRRIREQFNQRFSTNGAQLVVNENTRDANPANADIELASDHMSTAQIHECTANIPTAKNTEEDNVTESDEFFRWVQRQRRAHQTWADIALTATQNGHELSENALRLRYRRWCERQSEHSDD